MPTNNPNPCKCGGGKPVRSASSKTGIRVFCRKCEQATTGKTMDLAIKAWDDANPIAPVPAPEPSPLPIEPAKPVIRRVPTMSVTGPGGTVTMSVDRHNRFIAMPEKGPPVVDVIIPLQPKNQAEEAVKMNAAQDLNTKIDGRVRGDSEWKWWAQRIDDLMRILPP